MNVLIPPLCCHTYTSMDESMARDEVEEGLHACNSSIWISLFEAYQEDELLD